MATAGIESFFASLNNKLEPPVQLHLKRVYSCLAICLLSAAAGGYVHLFTTFLQGSFVVGLLGLVLLLVLSATPYESGKDQTIRLIYLMGFAFTTGVSMGPLLAFTVRIDPTIIPTAFLGTSVVFICFSLCAMLTRERKYLYLGGMLSSGLLLMLLMSVLNIFFSSMLIFQMNLYLGLMVMCGFILYDTQVIIEKRRRGDEDYIWHCVDLFIDFIGVFRRLLILLSQKEKKRND